MPGLILSGVIGGLIFGVILVWQGASAAGLVLLFTIVGWLIGVVLWTVWRAYTGQLDVQTVRTLIELIFSNRSR
ncbi:MAG: hypothetical protein OXE87_11130 [Chloroflexi bacterium]|nr:hypothetical protein [Chloroflexota bacterium]